MTRHQRTARACLAGTVLATSSAALATAIGYPGLCPIPVLAAVLCAEQAYRSYRAHRTVLVEHERARRAAVGPGPVVLLTPDERAAFQQNTSHYDDRSPA